RGARRRRAPARGLAAPAGSRQHVRARVLRAPRAHGTTGGLARRVRDVVRGRCGMTLETMPFARAMNAGLRRAMEEDPGVLLMGEDIGKLGGVFRVTEHLQR